MKHASRFLALLLIASGCGSAEPGTLDTGKSDAETADSVVLDTTPDSLDSASDAGAADMWAGQDGQLDGAPESGQPGNDAGPSEPDAMPPGMDARPDLPAAPDALAPDAGTAPEASADRTPDAVSDAADADAGTAPDGAADARADGAGDGGVEPLCTSTLPACDRANATDALIRATFPQPCTPDGLRKCGGVNRGVLETLPMICNRGMWRLAGSWSGVQWVPLYECSVGCPSVGSFCGP